MSDAKTERARIDREANADAPPQPTQVVQLEGFNITIASTGRPFQLAVPVDMTEGELLEVAGWMCTALRSHFAARRAQTAGGRIILPGRPS